ncbi:DUF362 domain-containing protein [Haliangium sp.]|uniref:DUF362 domain-containing protein n=1 Tax=Haliangium sp. TaxID=2663208 RepID=UPI003D0B2BE8
MSARERAGAGPGRLTRRRLLAGGGLLAAGVVAAAYGLRRRIVGKLSAWTQSEAFTATPALVPHDPARERRTLHVARGHTPAGNVDAVLAGLGGIEAVVGSDDVVVVKVSAQWWNQGMSNVAAVRRVIEHVLDRPGFRGEVVVFENVHFRRDDGSGLARAFTRPSERNVDVPGWTCLGDLIPHFADRGAAVSFVGLVDAGASALAGDHWHDPEHVHGVYGGDGRGPIEPGASRDGYHWDLADAFAVRRSPLEQVRAPLSWPRFTSPRSGLVIDLRDGLARREGERLVPVCDRGLTWINLTTCNEHAATGITAACKSTMGVVDMSAGWMGTHPLARGYRSVHYFGHPDASWRLAGPLAHFARAVRAPDLHLTVAEWVGVTPTPEWDGEVEDIRLSARAAHRVGAVVAGTDPVAIDAWCCRNLLAPLGGARGHLYDLDDPDSKALKFLREYRRVLGAGTLDPSLISVA